ncbi:hypothetical protein [Kocuria rhizosphaericola]|uniref:hypothetical protein n=1 Tax=Kocuria rhizosphaericola TaxID=3376284 RepID=UPI0037B3D578
MSTTRVVSHHESACAIRADGTVWVRGRNHAGQLGNGTTADSSAPVRVRRING